jgi:uncharacterized repeat protein (TIGR03803 family)
MFDRAGNLYGTTSVGGANGKGVVFELTPAGASWKETVLYSFCSQSNCADGENPISGLIMDAAGNLYGTTLAGKLFELSPSAGGWTEQVIYGGGGPNFAGLTMDATGNIFGGGSSAVFELSPNGNGGWNPTVLHTFPTGTEDGSDPNDTPVLDEAGNLYGTTQGGGANGYGTVYELSPGANGWTEQILYSFGSSPEDGTTPLAAVVLDPAGNIYGATRYGGTFDIGTVFELTAPVGGGSYNEKVLWSFDGANGYGPLNSLILDSAGKSYGTTYEGGPIYGGGDYGNGVVFEVNPSGVPTTATIASSPNPSTLGQATTFTAELTSSAGAPPNGEIVTFYNGAAVLASAPLGGGAASLTTSSLPVGTFTITASYAGDGSFGASTSALQQTVVGSGTSKTTTILSSSLNPAMWGQAINFTAAVTSSAGTPANGELITFEQNSIVLGRGTLSGGSAVFTTSALAKGIDDITAVYLGDATFSSSTSNVLKQVVDKTTTATTLAPSENPSSYLQLVSFTATVTSQFGGPVGSVGFYNGTSKLAGRALSNGVASFTTTKLPVGTASIVANYEGDSVFDTSTSAAVRQVVGQASTTTTLVSSRNPTNPGQSVTFTAAVAGQFGGKVTGSVTFMDGTTALDIVDLSGGRAEYKSSTLAVGTHDITATYNGSTDFTSSSASLTQTVN